MHLTQGDSEAIPHASILVSGNEEILGNENPVQVLVSTKVARHNELRPASIVVSTNTGKIKDIYDKILPRSYFPNGTLYRDCGSNVIMPGLVDAHVHFNDPGRREWEGFYSGTRAAATGGVTTVVDMPLNSLPPTTTTANLRKKISAAQGRCWVDVGFYGGIIPGNIAEIKPLIEAGIRGFKAFLIDSGVAEFPAISLECVEQALRVLKNEQSILLFHAEMAPPMPDPPHGDIRSCPPSETLPKGPVCDYTTFLQSRPPSYETRAIKNILSLVHVAPDLPIHIVHLSTIDAIPLLRKARANGIKVTAETCPHYLSLDAEHVKQGDTRYKCCPPIRSRTNQDGLWAELLKKDSESVIKTIVSDHSPCTAELKRVPVHIFDRHTPHYNDLVADNHQFEAGDFFQAWGGISSIGLLLPVLWTGMSERGLTNNKNLAQAISNVVRWCCANTASQVGLSKSKGCIAPGFDADFCVFDPGQGWTVRQSDIATKNKLSPYVGKKMCGVVKETWVRGSLVFCRGGAKNGFVGQNGIGKLLLDPRGKEGNEEGVTFTA